jgi:hypothetical protein
MATLLDDVSAGWVRRVRQHPALSTNSDLFWRVGAAWRQREKKDDPRVRKHVSSWTFDDVPRQLRHAGITDAHKTQNTKHKTQNTKHTHDTHMMQDIQLFEQ